MSDTYCDIAKAFRQWLLKVALVDAKTPVQIRQGHPITECARPAIWYETTDTEGPECLEIDPKYIPSVVFLNLEIHSPNRGESETVAALIVAAMEKHPIKSPGFDFDGTTVDCLNPENQDADYTAKAPGSAVGEFVVSMFVEITT